MYMSVYLVSDLITVDECSGVLLDKFRILTVVECAESFVYTFEGDPMEIDEFLVFHLNEPISDTECFSISSADEGIYFIFNGPDLVQLYGENLQSNLTSTLIDEIKIGTPIFSRIGGAMKIVALVALHESFEFYTEIRPLVPTGISSSAVNPLSKGFDEEHSAVFKESKVLFQYRIQ